MSGIQQPEVSPVQKTAKKSSKSLIVLILLILLCCIFTVIIGIVIFLMKDSIFPQKPCMYNSVSYNDKETFPSLDGCNTCTCTNGSVVCTEKICVSPVPSPEITLKVTKTVAPTSAQLKTYSNGTYNYSLKYPADWTLDSSKASFTTESQGDSAVLTITKGEYKFIITKFLLGRGVPVCIFDNQDPGDLMDYIELGAGKSLTTLTGETWKRNLNWYDPGYIICEKKSVDEGSTLLSAFMAYTDIGQITYETPEDADPEMIKLLDQIAGSIRYLGSR